MQTLIRELMPVVYHASLLCRLRSRAGEIERTRVARELHDGIIQSLISAEMHIHVLRQRVAAQPNLTDNELSVVQRIVHEEVINLRELMQRMKPIDLEPEQLPGALADIVSRFQGETNISVSLAADLVNVALPPRTCAEVARIVQEALSNVRKHSGARRVQIQCARDDGQWKLVIEDDGRGFGFAGRISQRELDRGTLPPHPSGGARPTWRGPMVIKDSVRAIGGELVIESTPGRGARLEIVFPETPRERADLSISLAGPGRGQQNASLDARFPPPKAAAARANPLF
jgi:two-component system nitrate/nitrite sensor histidine kinase NarX